MISFRTSQTSPIGLHIDGSTATLVQLSGPPGAREPFALAHGKLPIVESKSSEEQDKATAAAIRQLVSDHQFRGRHVVSCFGAQELFVQNMRLPKLPTEEIQKVVNWEAEERLPYGVADAEIRHLVAGQVRQDSNLKQEIILLACHKGVVQRHIHLLEMAGLQPAAIDIEPCAVLRSLQEEDAPSDSPIRCGYLNLGQRSTTVLIAEQSQILFLKYIATGADTFDKAVARHLDLSLDEAASVRANVNTATQLDSQDELHRSVIEAIRETLEAVAGEIELCMRYYKVTFRGKPLDRVILTGPDSSPWLAEFLSRQLRVPCEVGRPFGNLKGHNTDTALSSKPGRWATALGLAMKC